tara:strand:- start:200 stop:1003 length:804 start_codon:yes stop_codon:yes gene_type:complete
MINNNIVLFDMDGTLTEPRGDFDTELFLSLRKLSKYAEIGIVTGSDMNYIEDQLLKLMKFSELRFKLHILPCNGTKYYKPPKYPQDDFVLSFEKDMAQELSYVCLREIFKIITKFQSDACYTEIPLAGHFVSYRGSMINWCPIGRKASSEQRSVFVEYDKLNKFRDRVLHNLRSKINLKCPNKVVIKKGGETSFDIYPVGWDKTYALKHFKDKTCWFVGDRCEPSGNDYEIYNTLAPLGRAFQTSNTIQTGWIIENEIIPKLKGENK